MNLHDLWTQPVKGYLLAVAWVVLTAGWGLLVVLWGVQAYMAASGARWPAMYVHLGKFTAGLLTMMFFLLSVLWREPSAVLSFGAFSRNIAAILVTLALFLEAVWRIGEAVRTRGIKTP